MARYQVILAYDGTAFSGYQRQAIERTVQGVVEEALVNIGWQGTAILGAGRTDAGVHASGQVVAFDLEWEHSEEDLQKALNANLPADAAAQKVRLVGDSFHPRYDALSRGYRYHIFCQPHRDPLRERFAWRVWPTPDPAKMQAACQDLVGSHDFAAFGTAPKPGGSTIREIFAANWHPDGDGFQFTIEANAFLYHMVRRITWLMIEIGQGKSAQDDVTQYLSGERGLMQGLAPAQGLFLETVRYPEVSDNER